jgi:hypothetical protein
MANTNIDLVGLDFISLKNNLKTFLKTNTQFKDLDYEGSNINVLLDVLAYNSYLNAFYTNMVASEMFLDTAQLRDSIVSHAKELNYVPRSFTSAKATITVRITPSTTINTLLIPKYTSFSSRLGSNTYTFTAAESRVVTSANGGVFEQTLDVFEGTVRTESFVFNYANTTQRFVISNPTVDVSSLDVTVYEDGGQTIQPYTLATQLYEVRDSSKVYFVQPAQNQQYELVFGDNVFGRKPKDGSTVVVRYRASSGELPNGARVFSADGPIDGHSNVSITTVTSAAGGAISETVESIRFNAPRAFQAQNRAVTASDYETILQNRFSDIQAISVYGGEEASPPRYGRVYISVDVAGADGAPETRKQEYLNYIKDKTPLTIQVEFVDPSFLYVAVDSTVYYNANETNKTTSDIETMVQGSISTFNAVNLSDFKKTLYYSTLVSNIDDSDISVIGNDTELTLIKRIIPTLNEGYAFTVSMDNALQQEQGRKLSVSETHFGHTFTSSSFIFDGVRCILVDDSIGNVFIAVEEADTIRVIRSVGSLNYNTGVLTVGKSFIISSYEGNYIELRFKTLSKNIQSKTNTIIAIDPLDVTVTAIGVKQ